MPVPFLPPGGPGGGALASLNQAQIDVLVDAAQRGELTPEAKAILDANPGLKDYLPPAWRALLEAGGPDAGGSLDNAISGRLGKDGKLPGAKLALPEGKEAALRELTARLAPARKYDWRRSAYVSRLFESRLSTEERGRLEHFGHALFEARADASGLPDVLPIPDDYVIVPGDEFTVRVWGRMESIHSLKVDRDGKVFLSKFGGSIPVAGKTFREVKAHIRSKVEAVPQLYADVSMGQIRGFQVSALGEVEVPGKYRSTSLQTALQLLSQSGGIRDIGSLRRVQVRRGKETVAEIDLYDYLLRGDVTQDMRLQSGDAVFVPVSGPLVAVAGEVRREAIYELKGEKTLGEVLEMAGGLSPAAWRRRVQLERLEANLARVVLDVSLDDGVRAFEGVEVRDGDIVRVLAVTSEDENAVFVAGNVHRPGKYAWKEGLTVAGLIPDETFFLKETFLDYALLIREVGPERRKVALPLDLRKAVVDRDPAGDVPLRPRDTLMIYRESAFRDDRSAGVRGAVRNPGTYRIYPGTRVSDLVKSAGDLTHYASRGEAELSRLDEDRKVKVLKIDLDRALQGDEEYDLPVQDQDVLSVRPVPDLQEVRTITLWGEVRSPGEYTARKGERLSSVLLRAGGFTSDAFLKGAVFTRVSVQKRQQELIDRTVDTLEQEIARTAAREQAVAFDREDVEAQRQILESRRALLVKLKQTKAQGRVILRLSDIDRLKGTEDDLAVEDGDRLEIPRPPAVVNVFGRVYNPTGVVFNREQRSVGYYLGKVGGPTKDADKSQIFLVRADGSVTSREQMTQKFWFSGESDLLSAPLEAGDSIVVPEKLEYSRVMKDVKDITQILYQIAVSAGVLLVAF
jgi:protein involved in polysaccharide export with SLBB domain